MKKIVSFVILMALIACTKHEHRNVYPAVKALIHRVVPQIENNIIVDSVAGENGKDVFEIYSEGDKIVLAGSSPVAVATALNWYLKYYCHCHFSRVADNMNLPNELPAVKEKVRIVSPCKYRYWLNYCTYNYTMSFWGWKQWERELDWAAMQGINLMLAINGSEQVWQNTMRRYGCSEKEISDFICGPAYQAWWLMGNLEGWGGPVSQEWIKSRTDLQNKILSYMRGMNMEPVFQGFYGMVPTSLKAKFPKADIRSTGLWCEYVRPDFAMPSDTTFDYFAQIYYEELDKLFGKAKFYGGDPFHEGKILDVDLKTCGANIQKSMQKAVPGSTWVLQGWLENPSSVLLSGVDKDHVLVLDLFGETLADWNKCQSAWMLSKGFSGCRWIWNTVSNFGGRTGLHGKLDSTTMILGDARKSEYGKRLEGIGVMPEGSHINPFVFEYMFELGWCDSLPVPEKWAEEYSVFRYGKDVPAARSAWKQFTHTIYNIPMRYDEPQNVICSRPTLKWTKSAPWGLGRIQYKQEELKQAVKDLLSCSSELKDVATYQYDVVDMTHQYLIGVAEANYDSIVAAFNEKNKEKLSVQSEKFLALMKDLDELMGTRSEFLLGRWIEQARLIAPSQAEKNQFEQNARMLITTWGYGKQHETLNDYTHHEWSGLISSYYMPRWEAFLADLSNQLNGNPAKKIDYVKMEEDWTKQVSDFPVAPKGNAVETAIKFFEKYK